MMMYKDGQVAEKFKGRREWDVLTEFIEKHTVHEETKSTSPQKVLNEEGLVRAVDPSGFHALLDEGPTFVKFYAPWYAKSIARLKPHLTDKWQVRTLQEACAYMGSACGCHEGQAQRS